MNMLEEKRKEANITSADNTSENIFFNAQFAGANEHLKNYFSEVVSSAVVCLQTNNGKRHERRKYKPKYIF